MTSRNLSIFLYIGKRYEMSENFNFKMMSNDDDIKIDPPIWCYVVMVFLLFS